MSGAGAAPLPVRPAAAADLPALHALIERAYRGDAARAGWTHEADLVAAPRTSLAELAGIVGDPDGLLLLTMAGDRPVGGVALSRVAPGIVHLGMLTVDPDAQAAGLGRRLLAAAERIARDRLGATTMRLSVISVRAELAAYYRRRGYVETGELRPFPVVLEPPLFLMTMAKPLARGDDG